MQSTRLLSKSENDCLSFRASIVNAKSKFVEHELIMRDSHVLIRAKGTPCVQEEEKSRRTIDGSLLCQL